MMPIATAILGIAGAFATTSMGTAEARVSTMGHRFISSATPCDPVKLCQTENTGVICRVIDADPNSAVLTGKVSTVDQFCPIPLYRDLP